MKVKLNLCILQWRMVESKHTSTHSYSRDKLQVSVQLHALFNSVAVAHSIY